MLTAGMPRKDAEEVEDEKKGTGWMSSDKKVDIPKEETKKELGQKSQRLH